jgi:hypothetical protein
MTMRRAYFESGFITASDGTLQGIGLGYDRCHEHESGAAGISTIFGVPVKDIPVGIEDRTATHTPNVMFGTYKAKPRDKRRRAFDAAYLAVASNYVHHSELEKNPGKVLEKFGVYFVGEMSDPDHKPQYDLVCAWARDGFVIHVRGAANIAYLHELRDAISRCDIAIGLPWARAFLRGGVSFVIPSRLPQDAIDSVIARDLAHKKLIEAAHATGIYEELEKAGKRYHALGPDWVDPEKQDEVMFFLNPWEQKDNNHGWFTVEELRAWCRNEGIIKKDPKLTAFAAEHRDFGYDLVVGMKAQDMYLRVHEVLTWADEAKTVIGARLLVSKRSQHLLPSGVYPVQELMQRFPVPLD